MKLRKVYNKAMTKTAEVATKQDLKELGDNVRKDVDDVLTEMRSFVEMVQFRFDQVDKELAEIKSEQVKQREDIRKIFTMLDSIEKQLEITEDERLVMGYQLERAHRWIQELADKIGVKLTT